jgi:Flp pilus assembly protein TadD
VLQVQPRNALAMNNVAWLLAKQGKSGAVAMAESANALMPERPQLLDTLATALAAEQQVAKAIETQKRALALSPQDPALKLNLARHYLQNGEKPRARAELEDLARLGERFGGQAEVSALLKTL